MRFFGYRIIRESQYQNLTKAWAVECRLLQAYRWFSGWKDLDCLFTFCFLGNKKIEDVRKEYAIARNTDEYGKDFKEPETYERC